MNNPRTANFRAMLARNPRNALANFGIGWEALKDGDYETAVRHIQVYLDQVDDEGNAWGRLAEALEKLGRIDEAKEALRRGIAAATRHNHPSMVEEFEGRLDKLR
jgi:predicted Zn-dependent protease